MDRATFEAAFRTWRQNARYTGLKRNDVIALASGRRTGTCRAWLLNLAAEQRREGRPTTPARLRDASRSAPRPDLP